MPQNRHMTQRGCLLRILGQDFTKQAPECGEGGNGRANGDYQVSDRVNNRLEGGIVDAVASPHQYGAGNRNETGQ